MRPRRLFGMSPQRCTPKAKLACAFLAVSALASFSSEFTMRRRKELCGSMMGFSCKNYSVWISRCREKAFSKLGTATCMCSFLHVRTTSIDSIQTRLVRTHSEPMITPAIETDLSVWGVKFMIVKNFRRKTDESRPHRGVQDLLFSFALRL